MLNGPQGPTQPGHTARPAFCKFTIMIITSRRFPFQGFSCSRCGSESDIRTAAGEEAFPVFPSFPSLPQLPNPPKLKNKCKRMRQGILALCPRTKSQLKARKCTYSLAKVVPKLLQLLKMPRGQDVS